MAERAAWPVVQLTSNSLEGCNMLSNPQIAQLKKSCLALVAFAALCWPPQAAAQQELNFATGLTQFRDLGQVLPRYLQRQAEALLQEREREIVLLQDPQSLARRRAYVKQAILEAIGGLPERTPLNARVVGVIDQPGYRIEKVIFESLPGFYVTANLYLPKQGQPPYPAVLYPLGHEPGGKSYEVWQRMLATLATHGYVALTWDPVGQGERVQIWDNDLEQPKLGSSTVEHTMLGVSCLLVGDNLARYTIWDGIRALDYLLSRPEVDPKRIACTGNSGGGTQTAYLAALEDRIAVAAPSCYLTSWRWLLRTIGPQDAEQVLLPWLARKLDHGDFIFSFAPRPYLVLAAIRDFFAISGTRRTYEEARRVYQALGAKDRLAMAEVDAGHGYHQPNRLVAYRWLNRWLRQRDEDMQEPDITIFDFDELACTPTGQVVTSLGGETVFTLNRSRAQALNPQLTWPRSVDELTSFRQEIRRRVRQLLSIDPAAATPTVEGYGVIERDGYTIEKIVYWSEADIPIPSLLFLPRNQTRRQPVLWVDGRGKAAAASPNGDIEWWVRHGHPVLAVDLRGWGETRPQTSTKGNVWNDYFGDYDSAMTCLLLAKPLVGMRARDAIAGLNFLESRFAGARPIVIGRGAGTLPALYAAALDDRAVAIVLEQMLASYRSVVEQPVHRRVLESVVPGVLRSFDVQHLLASLAPRPILVVNPVDPLGNPLPLSRAVEIYQSVSDVYRASGAAGQFQIIRRRELEPAEVIYGQHWERWFSGAGSAHR